MKKILLSIAILLPAFCYAQDTIANKDTIGLNLPIKDASIIYSGVIEASNKTKSGLYKNARQWFVDYFTNSNNVIQGDDKVEGNITGKGIVAFKSKVNMGVNSIWYDRLTVKIECKDGRYRYSIYDMIVNAENNSNEYPLEQILGKLTGAGKFPWGKGVAKKVIMDNDAKIKEVIASINNQMSKPASDF